MKPILFNIGPMGIPSYYLFITLGIFLGLWFFNRYAKKAGFKPLVIIAVFPSSEQSTVSPPAIDCIFMRGAV